MPLVSNRSRCKPLALAVFATLLASMANAQPAQDPRTGNDDAAFRRNVGHHQTEGVVPGGVVVVSKQGNTVQVAAPTPVTPIQHVILIIGENRTFDHVFATYTPPSGQTVSNLLSKGIIKADGTPGANFALAKQWQASDTSTYSNAPAHTIAYSTLPQVNTGYAPTNPYFASASAAQAMDPGLETADYVELAEGGTGLKKDIVDTRFPAAPANGPIDTHSAIGYHAYANSPTHRFFQMWQEMDCSTQTATTTNPSGCKADLFPWVETMTGTGYNGKLFPSNFDDEWTWEGSAAMEFLNMAAGDAPYLQQLASTYSVSDNMHQSVMGGTGSNHIMLGFGTPIYYQSSSFAHATPPTNQIENPNPQQGTNNWYTQDGYSGGSYVDCASTTQPGVKAIANYLTSLPYNPARGCSSGFYYLVNNYNPGYLGDGTPAPLGASQYTVPPTNQTNIGTLMTKHGVSWRYYGEGWDGGKEDGEGGAYCNICNPFLFSSLIMTKAANRANLKDLNDLYSDIQANTLPQVSIVKPDGNLDGHPSSSKLDVFEGFTRKIVDMVQANPAVWNNTAIIITMDEGGGYYDSGYVQPVDFFGDGTRIPLLAVSPFSTGGKVVHTYYDHVSFDKFIEANWALNDVISTKSRDNLPNPVQTAGNPYVPTNGASIGNLMDMFNFTGISGAKD